MISLYVFVHFVGPPALVFGDIGLARNPVYRETIFADGEIDPEYIPEHSCGIKPS